MIAWDCGCGEFSTCHMKGEWRLNPLTPLPCPVSVRWWMWRHSLRPSGPTPTPLSLTWPAAWRRLPFCWRPGCEPHNPPPPPVLSPNPTCLRSSWSYLIVHWRQYTGVVLGTDGMTPAGLPDSQGTAGQVVMRVPMLVQFVLPPTEGLDIDVQLALNATLHTQARPVPGSMPGPRSFIPSCMCNSAVMGLTGRPPRRPCWAAPRRAAARAAAHWTRRETPPASACAAGQVLSPLNSLSSYAPRPMPCKTATVCG